MQSDRECEFIPVSFIRAAEGRASATASSVDDDDETEDTNTTTSIGCDDVKAVYEDVVGISDKPRQEQESVTKKRHEDHEGDIKCKDSSPHKRKRINQRKQHLPSDSTAGCDKLSMDRTTDLGRNKNQINCHSVRSINSFLKSAQEGNIKALKKKLFDGMYIDVQDSYGWTALMCAIHEKKTETVQFLLEQGASLSICDNQGVSTKEKALSVDCSEMHQVLYRHLRGPSQAEAEATQVQQSMFCDDCKVTYTCQKKHLTSTVHLLSTKKPQTMTHYGIPQSNRGFQMLLRSGWNEEHGLGPEGKGHKFPVKSRLKRDRLGLGSEHDKSKMRVTHFQPRDESAVKLPMKDPDRVMRQSTVSKRDRERQLSKQQCRERDFRLQFTME